MMEKQAKIQLYLIVCSFGDKDAQPAFGIGDARSRKQQALYVSKAECGRWRAARRVRL